METKLYRNTRKDRFELEIRLGSDPASNVVFSCEPGATMEGPAGYAGLFRDVYGLVEVDAKDASPKAEETQPATPSALRKKGG